MTVPTPTQVRRVHRLPSRPILPGREFGEPWPRPVFPVRCPKCRTYYVPTMAMAGGIRMNANGRVFSKRGLNFVKNDGTCPACNCDNPPGSGRNTTGCQWCPGLEAPASVDLTFIGLTYAAGCVAIAGSGAPRWLNFHGSPLGSYCVPMNGAGGTINVCGGGAFDEQYNCLWADNACSVPDPDLGSANFCSFAPGYTHKTGIYAGYGHQDFNTGGPLGWHVWSYGYELAAYFYGFTASADCFTPVTISNALGSIGSLGTAAPSINPVHTRYVTANGGSVILTPKAMLC